MRHRHDGFVFPKLRHTGDKREAIVEEMGIDLGLLLQLRFPDMDLLHVYMLEQLLDLLHHRVESRSQKTELVSARYLHPHRVIPGLQPAEHINQLLDRNLNLGVQQVCARQLIKSNAAIDI